MACQSAWLASQLLLLSYSFLLQFYMLGVTDEDSNTWSLSPTWKIRMEFQAPGLPTALAGIWGVKLVGGLSLCLSNKAKL